MKFKDICELIKKKDKELECVNILDMHEFITQERVTKKGNYIVKLQFDAGEILKNPNSIPRKRSDFIYRPFFLFLKYKPEKN